MSALNLVGYDSDDDDNQETQPKPSTIQSTTQKPSTGQAEINAKRSEPHQEKKPADQKELNTKRVIKYSSLQTSKNLLEGDKANAKSDEWKPTTIDFSKKNDPNAASIDKNMFKPKKGNNYAASFLSNLPKPKKELKNVSQNFVISDSFSYERDPTEEVIIKKIKIDDLGEDEGEDLDNIEGSKTVPHYSSLKGRDIASMQTFTEEDKQVVYQHDKSNKTGAINQSGIIEVSADSLADPDWEKKVEKKLAGRMFDSNKFNQPGKGAKSKNQLVALAYETVSNQDAYQTNKNEQIDARKRTFQRYGW